MFPCSNATRTVLARLRELAHAVEPSDRLALARQRLAMGLDVGELRDALDLDGDQAASLRQRPRQEPRPERKAKRRGKPPAGWR